MFARSAHKRVIAFAACLLLAGSVAAQQQGRRGAPPGEGGDRAGRPSAPREDDALAQQLEMLHKSLALDAKQELLWLAYTDKLQAMMSDMQRTPAPVATQPDALHQIEARLDPQRNRLAALEQIAYTAERLYRSLDERQRGVADQLLAATVPQLPDKLDCGRMPGGKGGPGDGGPEGGGPGGDGGMRGKGRAGGF